MALLIALLTMANIPKIQAQVRTYRGNLTKYSNRGDDLVELVTAKPTQLTVNRLRLALDNLDRTYQELEERYEVLIEEAAETPEEDTLRGRFDECDEVYRPARRRMLAALVAAEPVLAAPPAPAAVGAAAVAPPPAPAVPPRQVKEATGLKPTKLSLEQSPAELRIWMEQYEAYHEASNFNLLAGHQQRAYFGSCLDPLLYAKVKEGIIGDVPVFTEAHDDDDEENPPPSCMSLLQAEFDLHYPLFLRRHKFFQCKQEKNQPFSDFAVKLRQLGDECDLEEMGTNELYVHRYIGGVTDEKLRDKFLRESEPTYASLRAIARAHESAAASAKALEPKQAEAATAGEPGKPKKTPRCYRCGVTGHIKPDCQRKEDEFTCNGCGGKGHVDSVCPKKRWARGRGKPKDKDNVKEEKPLPKPGPSAARSVAAKPAPTNWADTEPPGYESADQVMSVDNATPRFVGHFTTVRKSRGRRLSFACEVLPDTGATRSIVSLRVAKKEGLPCSHTDQRLRAANGSNILVHGQVDLDFLYHRQPVRITALIAEIQADFLLSWKDMQKASIISANFPQPVCQAEGEDKIQRLRQRLMEEFDDVLQDDLGARVMSGGPMHIHLEPGAAAKAKRVMTAKAVPLHMRDAGTALIQKLLDGGILRRYDGPSTWISPAKFVMKPNGKDVRLVTDYTALNKFVRRPIHPFPSTDDILRNLEANSVVYCKMDAVHGYFQIPLDEESVQLTTFLLPDGKYQYLRAPMGLSASSDEFCARSDEAFRGHSGTQKIVDDALVCGSSLTELEKRVRSVLVSCRKKGITLSKKKFAIGPEVKFAGHIIRPRGTVLPDPDKVAAIRSFPAPTNQTELRSFLGLVNQLGFFIPDLAHISRPLNALLRKDTAFLWSHDQEEAFQACKHVLTEQLHVGAFNPRSKTVLLTDASRTKGLGFALMQYDGSGRAQRMVRCGSRALRPPETRYATIELEALAVVYGIEQCSFFLQGAPSFTVVTDHKPLEGLFGKDIGEVNNSRLLRFRERLMPYVFDLKWSPGKEHLIADALSRSPVFDPAEDEDVEHESIFALNVPNSLQLAATSDSSYRQIVDAVKAEKSWKELDENHVGRQQFSASQWQNLSLDDSGEVIILDGSRILVPEEMRKSILHTLHSSHCGIVKTKASAREKYFWPGMNSDIEALVRACSSCARFADSTPKEMLQFDSRPCDYPMQSISLDLASYAGHNYLVGADRFSGFPFFGPLRSESTAAVRGKLLDWFYLYGFPARIRTDNGPCFRGQFTAFCEEHGIAHETSSPYNSRSNSLAENAVKEVKKLLKKTKDSGEQFLPSLLELRNTPRVDGFSAAMLFFGRRLRTKLPAADPLYHFQTTEALAAAKQRQERQSDLYDKLNDQLAVPNSFHTGQRVRIQNATSGEWDLFGEIVKPLEGGRSYEVLDENGATKVRNGKFLASAPAPANAVYSVQSSQDFPTGGVRGVTISTKWADPLRKMIPHQLTTPPRPPLSRRPPAEGSTSWSSTQERSSSRPVTSSWPLSAHGSSTPWLAGARSELPPRHLNGQLTSASLPLGFRVTRGHWSSEGPAQGRDDGSGLTGIDSRTSLRPRRLGKTCVHLFEKWRAHRRLLDAVDLVVKKREERISVQMRGDWHPMKFALSAQNNCQ